MLLPASQAEQSGRPSLPNQFDGSVRAGAFLRVTHGVLHVSHLVDDAIDGRVRVPTDVHSRFHFSDLTVESRTDRDVRQPTDSQVLLRW